MSSTLAAPLKGPLQGHLKESAIAHLLVEGRLPADCTSLRCDSPSEPPMDLSTKSSVLTNGDGQRSESSSPMPVYMEQLHQTISNEMTQLLKIQYSAGMEWKCCFCPYTAKDRSKLLSHYQFHQQLLTSSSPASKSHYEWLSAYRQSRDYHKLSPKSTDNDVITTSKSSPSSPNAKAADPQLIPANQGTPHLRNLLTNTKGLPKEAPASASGFLRSIVQTIMQQNSGSPKPSTPGLPDGLTPESRSDTDDMVKLSNSAGNSPPYLSDGREFAPKIKEEHDSESDERHSPGQPLGSLLGKRSAPEEKKDEGEEKPVHRRKRKKKNATLDDVVRGLASSTSHARNLTSSRDDMDLHMGLRLDLPQMDLPPRVGTPPGHTFVNQQLRCLLNQRTRTGSSESNCLDDSPPTSTSLISPNASMMRSLNDIHLRNVLASQRGLDAMSKVDQYSFESNPLSQTLMKRYRYENGMLENGVDKVTGGRSDSEEGEPNRAMPVLPRESDYFVGEAQEGHCGVITRCDHCGITFDDEVIFSIHMGCHSHKDPFICNVCGRSCENKYAFYTHIMRGHQSVS